MKMVRRVLYWVTAFAVVSVTFWLGYTRQEQTVEVEKKPVPVEVEPVQTGSIEQTINVTGWVRANQVVDVTAKVSGRIESLAVVADGGRVVPVEEGVVVKKGQPLAVIDHDVYLAQVAAAQAAVKAREVELTDAERERRRVEALFGSGSATQQQRDKAGTMADLADASLNSARANLELAQINLRESTILSPIDGIVTVKYMDEGNLLSPGQRIVTVADVNTVKVLVTLAERYGGKVAAGMPARIRVDAFPDGVFDAEVYSVYPALDPQTHAVQVEIRVKNNELLLKPGMFASVTLVTERKENAVVVARDVVLGGKIDRHYVYVVEDGVARKRFVELGLSEAARYEITDGIKVGEKLVVNGMDYLADGIAVEIVRLEDIQ